MTKAEYKVIAREYRPQFFRDALGQDPIVTTLKNAIKFKRLAHAYLFYGPRGTGKTSIARIFAKAINCPNLEDDCEPCNRCSSCKEITEGNSLDVLEIDGASNRGIDEVRRINEIVNYTTNAKKYKIVIIDEVHMLTKEAFNALLKTLEEPPARAKFFFATTEAHKILPTILSRCQQFNFNRISKNDLVKKLSLISEKLNLSIEDEALRFIAQSAEGGMRDAESMLDQIISFSNDNITLASVTSILGIMPKDELFILDKAGKSGDVSTAFLIADRVFSEGKDISRFIETLIEHFRNILRLKLSKNHAACPALSKEELDPYQKSSENYTQEQLFYILDILSESQNQIRLQPSKQISLELALIKIIRSHQRISIESLVKKLSDLEKTIASPTKKTAASQETPPPANVFSYEKPSSSGKNAPPQKESPPPKPKEDSPKKEIALPCKKSSHYDTLFQFSAVELEGALKIKKTIH